MDGVADEVVAVLAQSELQQRRGAAGHLDPTDPGCVTGDQFGTGGVRGDRHRAGVRNRHGDSMGADGQRDGEAVDQLLDGADEQFPLAVGLGPVQDEEGRALVVVHPVQGQFGRRVVDPGVLSERHRRSTVAIVHEPVGVEGRDLLGGELLEEPLGHLPSRVSGVDEAVQTDQHRLPGNVVETGMELVQICGVTHRILVSKGVGSAG